MILSALNRLYQRLETSSGTAGQLPPLGYEWRKIAYVIEIDRDGSLVPHPTLLREVNEDMLVPMGTVGKTSGITACLLADKCAYVLGADAKEKDAHEKRAKFVKLIERIPDGKSDPAVGAVLAFYTRNGPAEITKNPAWSQINAATGHLAFEVSGLGLVHESECVKRFAAELPGLASEGVGVCLATGATEQRLSRLHPPFSCKYFRDAKSTGAFLVSFQKASGYDSYGREQGANAPISVAATYRYGEALRHLLREDGLHRIMLGDTTIVFWAEDPTEFDADFGELQRCVDPRRGTPRLMDAYQSVFSGKHRTAQESRNRFYVLGLAANSTRLVVRFWSVSSVSNAADRLQQHHCDLTIADSPSLMMGYYALLAVSGKRLRKRPKKMTNVIEWDGQPYEVLPWMPAALLKVALAGAAYPTQFLIGVIAGCREPSSDARKKKRDADDFFQRHSRIRHEQAAAIQAYLNRQLRGPSTPTGITTMNPDLHHDFTPAGRLGRLFALFEYAQLRAAKRQINRTVGDSYFASAMTSPRSVFPTLVKLNKVHLRDLQRQPAKAGLARILQADLETIAWPLNEIAAFPPRLNLEQQGQFALGYYHQMRQLNPPKPAEATPVTENKKT